MSILISKKDLPVLRKKRSPHVIITPEDLRQINYFLNMIRSRKYYSFIKFNHGLWDNLHSFGLEKFLVNGTEDELEKIAKEYAKRIKSIPPFWDISEESLFNSLKILKNAKDKNLYIGVGHSGNPGVFPSPKKMNIHKDLFKKFISPEAQLCDGLIWKKLAITTHFLKLFKVSNNMEIVLITPSYYEQTNERFHMKNLGENLKLKNYHHIEIDPVKACYQTDEIFDKIHEIQRYSKKDKIFIMQGGTVACEVIGEFHAKSTNSFFIDVGRALDPIFSYHIISDNKYTYLRKFSYLERIYHEKIKDLQ